MIKLFELIESRNLLQIPPEHHFNLIQLHYKVNLLRSLVKIPFMIITTDRPNAGYRSKEMQFSVYSKLNEERKKAGKHLLTVPWGSQHLIGAACDILDRDGKIQKWIKDHPKEIERLDLYFEHFDATPEWVHCQLYAPQSGERFFLP